MYRRRWTIETMFQQLEAHLHSEVNTLGYPKAALFAFCVALAARRVRAALAASSESEASRLLGGKTHPEPWHLPSRENLSQTSLAIRGANVQGSFGTAHHTRRGNPPPNGKRPSGRALLGHAREALPVTKSLCE